MSVGQQHPGKSGSGVSVSFSEHGMVQVRQKLGTVGSGVMQQLGNGNAKSKSGSSVAASMVQSCNSWAIGT